MAKTARFQSPWWRRLGLLVLLLVLGAGLTYLDQRGENDQEPVIGNTVGEPDYYLEDASMTRFDEQGRAYQRLETPRLVHTPSDDIIRTEAPHGYLTDDQQRQWQVTSQTGRLSRSGEQLTLQGDARLVQPEQAWSLETQTLHYDNREAHAWSDTPSVLRQHNQSMRGNRFDAWINEDRMRLTDNVQGRLPQQSEDQGS
ncbi:MAG: LPS export ABC transporter periplasmic protein LptC [Salinicola sp.]|uniref:LPS export ABC transporter periplasmic protein LptC n=1 Tax=Salinicola sp. TaxID=1978524 RepID=UPI000C892DE9|nr:LPS export ABC transporter periplasmic protein LptC [Salinicola sp.]MAM59477.1 LPS export ABC transporter periplasmic protein LptC [Salinicola sp.]NRB56650.1 LPS export ABC transporter periplasmic protein LptC [Salinicola sp.]